MKKLLIAWLFALSLISCKKENDSASACTVCVDTNGNERDPVCGSDKQKKDYCSARGWNVKL